MHQFTENSFNWGLTSEFIGSIATLVQFGLEIPFDNADVRCVLGGQRYNLVEKSGYLESKPFSIEIGLVNHKHFGFWNILDIFEFDLFSRLLPETGYQVAADISQFCSDEAAVIVLADCDGALTSDEVEDLFLCSLTDQLERDEAEFVVRLWGDLLKVCSTMLDTPARDDANVNADFYSDPQNLQKITA